MSTSDHRDSDQRTAPLPSPRPHPMPLTVLMCHGQAHRQADRQAAGLLYNIPGLAKDFFAVRHMNKYLENMMYNVFYKK